MKKHNLFMNFTNLYKFMNSNPKYYIREKKDDCRGPFSCKNMQLLHMI